MSTNYIAVPPGSTLAPNVSIRAYDTDGVSFITGNLTIPTIQNITINNSNDVFTWTQLNESAKLQIATTSTNSMATTVVVESATFFGDGGVTTGANALGLIGLSVAKTKCQVRTKLGSKTFVANAYVTGLAPTVSADQPVWTTPVTFTVSGEYTVV